MDGGSEGERVKRREGGRGGREGGREGGNEEERERGKKGGEGERKSKEGSICSRVGWGDRREGEEERYLVLNIYFSE